MATTRKPAAKTPAKVAVAKPKPAAKVAAILTPKKLALTKVAKAVTSWSFSRYGDYKKCPLAFKLKHIDKIQEPKSAAMQRGIDIHNLAEAYVVGKIAKLPPELALFKDEFAKLRKMYKAKKLPMIVEDNWAFTADWEETQWNDWVRCWVRIKLDCAHYAEANVMFVTDYKTGKMSEYKNVEYMEQLELYALAALLMAADPDNVVIKPRLLYLDSGDTYPPPGQEISYTAADLPKLKKVWEQRVKPMMTATNFPPRANDGCRWCFYGQSGKAKGGPGLCQF